MKLKLAYSKFLFLFLLLSAIYTNSSAQIELVATINKTQLRLGEIFEVEYRITNLEDGSFEPPKTSDIEVLDLMQVPYGRRSIIVTMVARTVRSGDINIPPATIKTRTSVYKTNRIKIHVSGRGGPSVSQRNPSPATNNHAPQTRSNAETSSLAPVDQLIFIRRTVSNKNPYIGEPIQLVTKLYYMTNFQTQPSEVPKYKGFWHQTIDVGNPMDHATSEVVNGKTYTVVTIAKDVLIPQENGTLQIGGFKLEGQAMVPRKTTRKMFDPFEDFFNDPFFNNSPFGNMSNSPLRQFMKQAEQMMESYSYEMVPVTLNSGTITITTKTPPRDKNGKIPVVGKYSISGRLYKTKMTMDDIDTFELTISGEGDPSLIIAPVISHPELEFFATSEQDSITQYSPIVKGYKKIYYTFTPNNTGDITFPSVYFSYFDPTNESLKEAITDSIQIHVDPGKTLSKQEAIAQNKPSDIIYEEYSESENYWISKPGAWALWSAPFLAYLLLGAYSRRQDKLKENTLLYKKRQANKIAQQRLENAKQLMEQNQNEAFFTEINKALWLYVSDKSEIPLSNINKENVFQWMQSQKVPSETINDFLDTTRNAEMKLYASGDLSSDRQQAYQDAVNVISELQTQIKN